MLSNGRVVSPLLDSVSQVLGDLTRLSHAGHQDGPKRQKVEWLSYRLVGSAVAGYHKVGDTFRGFQTTGESVP